MRRTTARLTAAAFVGLLVVSGCGASPLSRNKGGDTECGDYLEMPEDERREAIRGYFEDKGNADPAAFEVTLALHSAALFCNTVGASSDPIRKIDTG